MNAIDQVRQRLAQLNSSTSQGSQAANPIAGNRPTPPQQRPPQAVKTAKGVVEG